MEGKTFVKIFEKAREIDLNTCDWEMGIDEAGRGPVLGPMVYGAACWPISLKNELSSLGFDDSKKLSETQREALFEIIKDLTINKLMSYEIVDLDPSYISQQMLSKSKISLNEISFNAAYKLIDSLLISFPNIKRVYIDTVGSAVKYKERLEKDYKEKNPGLQFIVEEKADSKFPVVSAASICAKVTRDDLVANWVFRESNGEKKYKRNFGSGYPSDPITKEWLVNNYHPFFGFPDFVRFSWGTIDKLLDKNHLQYEFFSEKEGSKEFGMDIEGCFNKSKKGKYFGNIKIENNFTF